MLFLIGQTLYLLQLFNYTPNLFYKKLFKSEIRAGILNNPWGLGID
jgi:hypothetical protein